MRKPISHIVFSVILVLLLLLGVMLVMMGPPPALNGLPSSVRDGAATAAGDAAVTDVTPAVAAPVADKPVADDKLSPEMVDAILSAWLRESPVDTPGAVTIDEELLKSLLINMPLQRRRFILNNTNAFIRFVAEEARHQALLNMALAQDKNKQPQAQFLMRRGSGRALREYYVRQYLNDGVAADYPSEQQIREHYEERPERYRLPRRVHLWQVFLPLAEDADEETVKNVLREIEDIGKRLRSEEIGLAEAARRHSRHGPSRSRGGYMGLVAVDQLRGPFQHELETLPENRLSKALRDKDGYHLIQHGGFVEGRQLPLSEASSAVRNDLRNQARQALRDRLVEEALRQYPHSIQDEQVREWWQRLRAEAGIAPTPEAAGQNTRADSG